MQEIFMYLVAIYVYLCNFVVFGFYPYKKKVMTKGATAVPKPNRETAIPAAFLCFATRSKPSTKIKIPRATIPRAIGFIIS
jgi:hypothetical protein